jgi:hypothetical protein
VDSTVLSICVGLFTAGGTFAGLRIGLANQAKRIDSLEAHREWAVRKVQERELYAADQGGKIALLQQATDDRNERIDRLEGNIRSDTREQNKILREIEASVRAVRSMSSSSVPRVADRRVEPDSDPPKTPMRPKLKSYNPDTPR